MKSRTELLISFVQVGKSRSATRWLKGLTTSLKKAGAKYNIIDAVTTDQFKGLTLEK